MAVDRRFPSSDTPLLSLVLVLLLLLACAAAGESEGDNVCVYTVYVRTGSVIRAGTDSKIGLTLGDAAGRQVRIGDLEAWGGLMGVGHDYYERGGLDAFSGRVPCGLEAPLCRLNLTSDGSGPHHGWYCEYVEVTATGPHAPCSQTLFYVRQWLASDAPPYQLYALVDGCERAMARVPGEPFVVGNRAGGSAAVSSSFYSSM